MKKVGIFVFFLEVWDMGKWYLLKKKRDEWGVLVGSRFILCTKGDYCPYQLIKWDRSVGEDSVTEVEFLLIF